MNLIKIYKSRRQLVEGIKNNIFPSKAIEDIAEERKKECDNCEFLDTEGSECYVPGTQPCCGSCGCSLKLKLRSLSSWCPEGKWDAVISEEDNIKLDELNPDQDEE